MMKWKNLWVSSRPIYGLSIYPNKANLKDVKEYLKLASKYNFNRVFVNLIDLKKEDFYKFKEACKYGNYDLGMNIIADIDESVLKNLNLNKIDTAVFSKLGIKSIRMDVKFDPLEISKLSMNKEGIQLEINASDFSGIEYEINKFKNNKNNIIASHNFFPQLKTGLSLNKFNEANSHMKKNGYKVSVFTAIKSFKAINAWDDGSHAVTLEITREMELYDQFQYLSHINYVDIIICSNMYISKKEFDSISKIKLGHINFEVNRSIDNLTKEEEKILYYKKHKIRGDNPEELMLRSTISRKVFKDLNIPPKNNKTDLKAGDIVILNNDFGKYKGELHIMKDNLKNDGKRNLVGQIKLSQMPLLNIDIPNLEFSLNRKGEL